MARDLTGTGRVTIFTLLHDWETQSRCVLVYTTADDGLTAVMGVIQIPENVFEPSDLFALAGRHGFIGEWKGSHEQRCGCWLANTGTGSRLIRKPDTIEVPDAAWTLDMAQTVDLASTYYGHTRVIAGRMNFGDEALAARARALVNVSTARVPGRCP